MRFDRQRIGVVDDLIEVRVDSSTEAGATYSFIKYAIKNIATPKSSGESAMRITEMPAVRIAVTSLSPIKRPIASRAAKRQAKGKAIGIACGTRNMTKRSTRKNGACWLMM